MVIVIYLDCLIFFWLNKFVFVGIIEDKVNNFKVVSVVIDFLKKVFICVVLFDLIYLRML